MDPVCAQSLVAVPVLDWGFLMPARLCPVYLNAVLVCLFVLIESYWYSPLYFTCYFLMEVNARIL